MDAAAVYETSLTSLPLLPFTFRALGSERLFDAATDLIVDIIHHADCSL